MRYRLLQARHLDDVSRHDEVTSFATRLGVPESDIVTWDLITQKADASAVTDGVDAILVGGSGEYGVYYPHQWIYDFIDLLGELSNTDLPMFASCFGFQGLVVAHGGRVAEDKSASEVGTFEVERLPSSQGDPMFDHLPSVFTAQLGHKDRAMDVPSNLDILARSARCPVQAVKVHGKNIWATQFHPELSFAENLKRFKTYEEHYMEAYGQSGYSRMLDGFSPSKQASTILGVFHQWLLNHRGVR